MKKNNKILIVSARYYCELMNNMEADAKLILENNDHLISEYSFIEVPGVFEIPVILSKFINEFDGFIALGCVIKGETPHFNFISTSATDAIMKISVDNKKPVGNGILTCLNKQQAEIRSKQKGKEAAKAVISVLNELPLKVYPS